MIDYSETVLWEALMTPDDNNLVFGPDVIRDTVHKWLLETGWSIRKESPPNAYWAFVAEHIRGVKLVIGQIIDKGDALLVQCRVIVDDATRQRIDQLSPRDREELLWDLRFEVTRMTVMYQGIEGPLKEVMLSRVVYADGLTKNVFLECVEIVRLAALLLMWIIARKFGQVPPKQEMGFIKTQS